MNMGSPEKGGLYGLLNTQGEILKEPFAYKIGKFNAKGEILSESK